MRPRIVHLSLKSAFSDDRFLLNGFGRVWAAAAGVITGKGNVTRTEIATIMMRYCTEERYNCC